MTFTKKDARFWFLLIILVVALLVAVFGDTSRVEFLSWSFYGMGMDKVGHMLYMGALATIMARRWKMWPVVITGCVLAVAIEFIQPYFHRDRDMTDVAWGMVGTWFAWGLSQTKWYTKMLEKKVF